jgi:hypothetical protein
MKFIVFNIVVAVALVYLVSNKDSGFDVSLPKLGDVTAAAGQALDRAPAAFEKFRNTVEAPTISDADLIERQPLDVPIPVAERPLTTVPVPAVSKPVEPVVEPAVAQRRAEVLGHGPVTPAAPVRLATNRRRQLLDLAEEMEYLAAEFSVR